MDRAVVGSAERDRELIAGLAAECPRLHVPKMMGIGWLAAADQAGLSDDIAKVVPVAVPARFGDCEDALVDARGPAGVGRIRVLGSLSLRGCGERDVGSITINRRANFVCLGKLQQPAFEGLLHGPRIGGGEAVLGRQRVTGPGRGLIG